MNSPQAEDAPAPGVAPRHPAVAVAASVAVHALIAIALVAMGVTAARAMRREAPPVLVAEWTPPPPPGVAPAAPFDHWADILWMQQAMFDAPAARRAWDARPANFKPEAGNSLTFTEAWIGAFEQAGPLLSTPSGAGLWRAEFTKTSAGK